MKNALLIVFLFLSAICQKSFSQCSASIINMPHGDCEGTDIELLAPSGAGNTYQWTGPNGFACNNQFAYVPQATAAASGFYKLTVTEPGGCSASDSIEIIKHAVPTVYTGGNAAGCLGETTYILAQDFSGNYGPYTYLWDNGATTESLAVVHGGGSYPAPACTMTNVFGCSAMNYTTFLIYTLPTPQSPAIQALSNTTFCQGGSVTLSADPTIDSYQWNRNGRPIGNATGDQLSAYRGGDYTLRVSNIMGCSALSTLINVDVMPTPKAVIAIANTMERCHGIVVLNDIYTNANYTYEWLNFENPVSGANNPILSVNTIGDYKVRVTNEHGCVNVSNTITINSICRTEGDEMNAENSMHIFPNPSDDVFNLEFNNAENNELIISDVTGRTIEQRKISGNESGVQFGEHLKEGIYTVQVMNGSKLLTQKIIKTK